MFKDYYKILGLVYPSSSEEIKKAYRLLSLKWHPDRNPGAETTDKMVSINEAYFILKDADRKERYDKEYLRYQEYIKASFKQGPESDSHKSGFENNHYQYHDSSVQDDINTAHSYAKNLVEEFIKNLKETGKNAAKGAWEGAKAYLIIAIILPIIFFLIRSCQ